MRWHNGWVREVHGDGSSHPAAWISCPPAAIPPAGRYLLAADEGAILPVPLFTSQVLDDGFLAAPPIPTTWAPGTSLRLRGPLGHGFSIPEGIRRLALVAFGDTSARLSPLIYIAVRRDISVALFTNARVFSLPAAVEINVLAAISEALSWADYLMADVPFEVLPGLRAALGVDHSAGLPCRGQALVVAPMPCGGMADCGVCAFTSRRGWKYLCKDGPVVDLSELIGS